jgi:hypothetical protein
MHDRTRQLADTALHCQKALPGQRGVDLVRAAACASHNMPLSICGRAPAGVCTMAARFRAENASVRLISVPPCESLHGLSVLSTKQKAGSGVAGEFRQAARLVFFSLQ